MWLQSLCLEVQRVRDYWFLYLFFGSDGHGLPQDLCRSIKPAGHAAGAGCLSGYGGRACVRCCGAASGMCASCRPSATSWRASPCQPLRISPWHAHNLVFILLLAALYPPLALLCCMLV